MSNFLRDERIKLVNKETGVELNGAYDCGYGDGEINVRFDGTSISNVISGKDWIITKIAPTNEEVMAKLKEGSVIKFNNETTRWFKTAKGWVSDRYGQVMISKFEAPEWKLTVEYSA